MIKMGWKKILKEDRMAKLMKVLETFVLENPFVRTETYHHKFVLGIDDINEEGTTYGKQFPSDEIDERIDAFLEFEIKTIRTKLTLFRRKFLGYDGKHSKDQDQVRAEIKSKEDYIKALEELK